MANIDRKTLLRHWFSYYGHVPYTFEELEIFNKLLDEQEEKILSYIVTSYLGPKINGRVVTTEILIKSIRENKLDSLLDSLPNADSFTKKELLIYNSCVESILKQCEETYKNPKEPNYMDLTEMLNPGESAVVLNVDNIDEPNKGITIVRKLK